MHSILLTVKALVIDDRPAGAGLQVDQEHGEGKQSLGYQGQ